MGEVSQNSEPVEYNLVAFAVFDIGDKTNTARVVLIARTVQAVIKILISTVKHAKPLVFSPQSPTVRYPETPGNPAKSSLRIVSGTVLDQKPPYLGTLQDNQKSKNNLVLCNTSHH